jgi:hypothetical protein
VSAEDTMTDETEPRALPWWVLIVALLILVLLTLALWRFVRDVVAVPVARILWAADILFSSIPQVYYWALLLGIVIYMALKSLYIRRASDGKRQQDENRWNPGPVEVWASRIRLVRRGEYSKRRFAYHLGKLLLDTLAYEERLTYRDIEDRLADGTLDVPPEVRAYLNARLDPQLPSREGLLIRIQRWLGLNPPKPSPLDSSPEIPVRFLEQQLEVAYEPEDR